MINILPPDVKKDFKFGLLNRQLVRWNLALVAAILGVILIVIVGQLIMDSTIKSYSTKVTQADNQLKSQNLTGIQQQVSGISGNLRLMVQVLSKEILFSNLLGRLGSITPSNVILTNLSIAQNVSAIDVTAQSSNYTAATQLQVNMADPANQVFSKADIVSITCATGKQVTNPNYPCTSDIRGLLSSNNPFLFINSQGTHK